MLVEVCLDLAELIPALTPNYFTQRHSFKLLVQLTRLMIIDILRYLDSLSASRHHFFGRSLDEVWKVSCDSFPYELWRCLIAINLECRLSRQKVQKAVQPIIRRHQRNFSQRQCRTWQRHCSLVNRIFNGAKLVIQETLALISGLK